MDEEEGKGREAQEGSVGMQDVGVWRLALAAFNLGGVGDVARAAGRAPNPESDEMGPAKPGKERPRG